MAWSIGSNDAANAMGTSVGSRAVTFKEAVIIAAVFEFSGAYLAGASVTNTMRKGIIDPALFNDVALVGQSGPELFAIGMLAALISAAIWIHIAAFLGWPVSTTHSIVGAITGFGIAALGIAKVNIPLLASIVASWAISPVVGGILAFLIFTAIKRGILDRDEPVKACKRWAPVLAFPTFFVLSLVLAFKGLKPLKLEKHYGEQLATTLNSFLPYSFDAASAYFTFQMLGAVLVGMIASALLGTWVRQLDPNEGKMAVDGEPDEDENQAKFSQVERVFRYLQTITACFVAFAHGSNDVANSIGPLAAVVSMFDGTTFRTGAEITGNVPVPTWVLLLGGIGIVIGLATYGWKVIETIGSKITDLTPSRGFSAEFGAASTILVGSQAGLPLSTTHTVVGSVIGVGFARGMNALNLGMIWKIIQSWIYTIPFTGGLTVLLFYLFRYLFI